MAAILDLRVFKKSEYIFKHIFEIFDQKYIEIDIHVDHGSHFHPLHPRGGHFGRHLEFKGVPGKIEPGSIEILFQDIKTKRSSHLANLYH